MPDSLPPDTNPFATIDPQMSDAAPDDTNPFSIFPKPDQHTTTGLGAATAHAARGVLPTAGGMVGAGAGAEIGAPIGAAIGSAVFPGPGTAVGAAIGGVAGGIGGFFGGSWLTGKAQDYAVGQMPDSWQDTLGQSEQAQRAQEAQHPVYSFLGGAAPYLLTMTPGALTTKALNLPADATAFQRIMANPITGRLFGGAAMGGMELGQEELDGESPDWTRVGISTGLGFFLNKPTQFGEYLTHAGAGPAYAAMAPVRNAAAGIYMLRSPLDIPREGVLNPTEPTVAQAADLGVMGAGITESTHTGGTEQSDSTKANAQTEAANEQATLGPLPTPNLDAIARRIEPDLFTQRDALLERADSLRQFIDAESNPTPEMFDDLASKQSQVEAALGAANPRSPDAANYRAQLADIETQRQDLVRRQDAWGSENYTELPEVMMARQHLADTNRDLLELGPTIAAARRRAADHAGVPEEPAAEAPAAETIPAAAPIAPEPGAIPAPQSEAPKSVADQRAFITADRTAQLVAAGMPRNQAEANAHIEAAYYETLSQRFGGRIGTPEELYRERSAQVVGPNGETPPPVRQPVSVTTIREAEPTVSTINPDVTSVPEVPPQAERMPWDQGERPRIPTDTEMKAAGISPNKFKATQEEAIGRLADWQKEQRDIGSALSRAVPETITTPSDLVAAKPNLRSESQIMREDKIGPKAAKAVWEREVIALADWQAAQKAEAERELMQTPKNDPGSLFQRAVNQQTETPEFMRWFEDSTVVDAEGKPLVVYHGTPAAGYETFHAGSHFGTAEAANDRLSHLDRYPNKAAIEGNGTAVYPVYLAIKNAKRVADAEDVRGWADEIAKAKTEGHDGLVYRNEEEGGGGDSWVAFQPEQIKSAVGNSGSFDISNPSILAQRAASAIQGRIRIMAGDVRSIITLARTSDASTFMHETGHDWLKQLMQDSQHALAPDELKADAATVRRWLKRPAEWTGFKANGAPDAVPQEKFARGFEQYLREGVAPSPGLARVFQQFKSWLTTIYRTLKGLGAPISDDIRSVFDRMLATEPQRTTFAEEGERQPSLAAIHETDAAETEPPQAEAVRDRVVAERDQRITEQRPEITNELGAAEPATDEPSGEVGAGSEGPSEVAGGGGEPEPVTRSSGSGAGSGAVEPGGGDAVSKSPELPSGSARRAGEQRPLPGSASGPEQVAPKPADRFPDETESAAVDLAGNVRVQNIDDSEGFIIAATDSAERNNKYLAVRGQTTMGAMLDLANAMSMNPADVTEEHLGKLFGGVEDLGPKIWALRDIISQQGNAVHDLWVKAATSLAPADLAAATTEMARFDMMMTTLSRVTAIQGRNLGMSFRNMKDWQKAKDLNQFMKDNTGKDLFQLSVIAKLGAKMDTPAKVAKLIRDGEKRSYGRMILEYWVNGLISGISTHVTYIVGNTLLAAEKAGPETAVASAIGSLRANLGRTGERVHIGEVGAQFGAAIREAPAAIQASLEAYRSGGTTMLPGEAARPRMPLQGDTSLAVSRGMTNAHVTWSELRGDVYSTLQGMRDGIVAGADLVSAGGVPGAPLMGWQYSPGQQIPDLQIRGINAVPLGTLARLPSRNVAAIHSGQRAMNYSMEINRLAYRQAFEEGLTGTPLASRIADIRQNPSEEMMEQARKVSTDLTLMGPAGKWVEKLSSWVNHPFVLPLLGETPLFKFVDPFVHIAANIMNQSLMQRTPIGLFSSEIRADLRGANGNVAADTTAAKMIVGTGLALTFGGLAAQGLASGSGPSDPDKAAMWRLAGNQAHSVRVGDMWYAVNRLGPMGMLMSVAADMYDVSHQIGKDDADIVGKSLMHAFTQNILDESFMRGPADLIKALTEEDHYGAGYVRNFLSSFIPYSVGMAQMARASDPYSRQARTIMDAIRAKVPGMSESLFPRRDIWGVQMPSGDALVSPGITAIYAKQMSSDPVNQAMLAMSVNPGPVKREIRNVHLTDQQYDDFARIAGHAAKMRLDTIVRSTDFQSWPPATRHEVMEEVIRQSRESARGWMMAKYPEIPKEAAKAQITRRTGGMGQQ